MVVKVVLPPKMVENGSFHPHYQTGMVVLPFTTKVEWWLYHLQPRWCDDSTIYYQGGVSQYDSSTICNQGWMVVFGVSNIYCEVEMVVLVFLLKHFS